MDSFAVTSRRRSNGERQYLVIAHNNLWGRSRREIIVYQARTREEAKAICTKLQSIIDFMKIPC